MNWILWLLIIALALLVLFKFKEIRHKLVYGGIALLLVFFIFSFGYVYIKGNGSLTDYESFVAVGKLYLNWLTSIGDNLKTITGYAAKQDWGLNSTISNIK